MMAARSLEDGSGADSGDSEYTKPLWNGTRFDNPWKSWHFPSATSFLKIMPTFMFKMPSIPSELDAVLPVHKPTFGGEELPGENEVRATWLGHAAVLFQLDGARVLCDPIFSNHCSPVPHTGPRRFRPVPCSVRDLPELDAVVISHTHYDHLDRASVLDLNRRFPKASWFVPAGCAGWMRKCGCQRVHELDWWEEKQLEGKPHIKLAFTPTQHWSGRGPFDRNKCLWGSWAIIGPRHRAWFAGDTGYCEAFQQIGRKYGPFDMAAIPIGAYCPQWFMQPQHVNPEEAVRIHKDIKSKKSFGMHWGTFTMTNEPLLEPREKLVTAVAEAKLSANSFITIDHGRTLVFDTIKYEEKIT